MIETIQKTNRINFQGMQSRIIYVFGTRDAFYDLSYNKNLKYTPKAIIITIEGKSSNAENKTFGKVNLTVKHTIF